MITLINKMFFLYIVLWKARKKYFKTNRYNPATQISNIH